MSSRGGTMIGIVGIGQIGGSLALAFRAHGHRVAGVDSEGGVAAEAVRRQVVDVGGTKLGELAGCGAVFVCVPLGHTLAVLRGVLAAVSPGTLVVDVASVKAPIVRAIDSGRSTARYVGGHPMFGSEREGLDAADAQRVAGSTFVLTPTESTDAAAASELERLVASVGMRPLRLTPEEHDAQVAAVSHLPYLLAASLALATPDARCAGPAFRDMTRVAGSPPALWREILTLNRSNVEAAAAALKDRLTELLTLEGDALEEALREAQSRRTSLAPLSPPRRDA